MKYSWSLFNELFTPICPCCNQRIKPVKEPLNAKKDPWGANTGLCAECKPLLSSRFMPPTNEDISCCYCCAEAIESRQRTRRVDICLACELFPPPYSQIRSLWYFDQQIEQLIKKLKYCNKPGIGSCLGIALANYLRDTNNSRSGFAKHDWDMVLAVPSAPNNERLRGYSHTAIIGRKLSRMLGVSSPYASIVSLSSRRSQASLPIEQRLSNIANSFRACHKRLKGKSILLIDDTVTSGATLEYCSMKIIEAGAGHLDILTLARSHSYQLNRIKLRWHDSCTSYNKIKQTLL